MDVTEPELSVRRVAKDEIRAAHLLFDERDVVCLRYETDAESDKNGNNNGVYLDAQRRTFYWARQEKSEPLDLLSCPLDSAPGTPVTRVNVHSKGDDVQGFAMDENYFYFSDEFGIWRAPKPPI